MPSFLSHLFFPQESNNHRPKILHLGSLFIVTAIVLASTFSLSYFENNHPQVLGISSDISIQDMLVLTNEQRQKNGVPPLVLNEQLINAAEAKAKDMISNDYWAHNSPSGKTPWVFIKDAGYDYVYAGENLARGFSDSSDLIDAWMASPEHRQNMLSPNFKDVGFAVERGNLTGEDTVLVVEELGSKDSGNAQGIPTTLSANTRDGNSRGSGTSGSNLEIPRFDSVNFSKNILSITLAIIIGTFLIDLLIIEKKKIARLAGHNADHILFLTILLICIILFGRGVIL